MIEIEIRNEGLKKRGSTQRWRAVIKDFREEAGALLVAAVQRELGQSTLYTLSGEWSDRKTMGKTIPQMVRKTGKASDQPLILSGEGIFEALKIDELAVGSTSFYFHVLVDQDKGTDRGFDYAEYWEEFTHYLEKGLAAVEDKLGDILASCVVRGMMLDA